MTGSNYYFAHIVPTSIEGAMHGPHIHEDAELMMHFGMNPDDPFDLGAEVELCMGSEMEKYTFTKSTTVYIPPNLIHCPWTLKKVDRPFLLIQIHQGATHTEKSYRQLLPKERFMSRGFSKPPKGFDGVVCPNSAQIAQISMNSSC